MPKVKQKTHRGAAKRFKVTGSGKIVRHQASMRHILTSKTRKRKRKPRKSTLVTAADHHRISSLLPNA